MYLSARVGFHGSRRGGIVYSLAFFLKSFFIILSLGMELAIYNITSVVPC